ncbi:MAG: H-NS histone family protein [Moraxellaceae bacterium]
MKVVGNTDLNSLSIEDLHSITENAQDIISHKQTQRLREAYEIFEGIAEERNSSIEEILSVGEEIKQERSIKYRDPDNFENSWTGRGRKPKWLIEKVNSGFDIEFFRVDNDE